MSYCPLCHYDEEDCTCPEDAVYYSNKLNTALHDDRERQDEVRAQQQKAANVIRGIMQYQYVQVNQNDKRND